MTEKDRMERARRIKRMREGKRVDEDEPEATEDEPETTADEPEATADSYSEPTNGDGTTETPVETPGDGSVSESTTDSADGAEVASSDAQEEAADRAVPDAIDSINDASASVPSAEEMASSVEGSSVSTAERADSEAAREIAEASAARAAEASAALATDSSEVGEAPEADQEIATDADAGGAAAEAGTDTEAEAATDTEAPGSADVGSTGATEERTRVLEFTLADEQYCLDIRYIEEIVKGEYITRVPNTPEFVEGVVDLRGQITTILNPKVTIGKDDTEAGDLIVVFDGEAFEEQGYVGWIVDDVRQVSPVTDEQINDPPMAEDYINGVIDREEDDEFVVWTSPDLAFEEA